MRLIQGRALCRVFARKRQAGGMPGGSEAPDLADLWDRPDPLPAVPDRGAKKSCPLTCHHLSSAGC